MQANPAPSRDSSNRLILVVTFLLVVIMAARSPLDSDLWWHLRAGQTMLQSGRPLLSDSFSYTRTGAPWVNHSWLGEVVLAGFFQIGGYTALTILVALVAALSLGVIARGMPGPAVLRAFLVILSATVAAVVWTARPQLFSLLLLAVTAWILFAFKYRGVDRLWLLPPLFVLWSNLHGGYPLGLLAIGALLAGETLNHLLRIDTAPVLPWRNIGRVALFAALAWLVVAINPNGAQMWWIPFKTVDVGALQQFIVEWASPDFHDPAQLPFLALLLGTAASLALSGRRADGTDLVTFLLFGGMGLLARRNFGPFALLAAPILARALLACAETSGLRDWLRRQPPAATRPRPGLNLAIAGLLAFVAIGKIVFVSHPALIGAQIEQDYPAGAVAYLRAQRPAGRLLNSYNWGGYLEYALPEYPVFVDGRTDLFGDEIIGQWLNLMQAGPGWQAQLDAWQIRLALIEPERPLAGALDAAGWKLLAQGAGYVLYGR